MDDILGISPVVLGCHKFIYISNAEESLSFHCHFLHPYVWRLAYNRQPYGTLYLITLTSACLATLKARLKTHFFPTVLAALMFVYFYKYFI